VQAGGLSLSLSLSLCFSFFLSLSLSRARALSLKLQSPDESTESVLSFPRPLRAGGVEREGGREGGWVGWEEKMLSDASCVCVYVFVCVAQWFSAVRDPKLVFRV
jgi:hypothetical protein